jgi:hypothetical protein
VGLRGSGKANADLSTPLRFAQDDRCYWMRIFWGDSCCPTLESELDSRMGTRHSACGCLFSSFALVGYVGTGLNGE